MQYFWEGPYGKAHFLQAILLIFDSNKRILVFCQQRKEKSFDCPQGCFSLKGKAHKCIARSLTLMEENKHRVAVVCRRWRSLGRANVELLKPDNCTDWGTGTLDTQALSAERSCRGKHCYLTQLQSSVTSSPNTQPGVTVSATSINNLTLPSPPTHHFLLWWQICCAQRKGPLSAENNCPWPKEHSWEVSSIGQFGRWFLDPNKTANLHNH